MATAHPGDVIKMADGEYRGEAFTTVSGTARRPITLIGSRRAVIVNDRFEQPTTPCPSGHTGYGGAITGRAGGPDASNRIRVIGNRFGPNIAAEHIDIKEGTVDGQVIGNVFDGRGLTGKNSGDSWVDAKGSHYLFLGNLGSYQPSPSSVFRDGYETHEQYDLGYGCGNVFRGNVSHLAGVGGYAVNVTNQAQCGDNPNVVYDSNLVFGAVSGLTNIPVTPERR